MSTWRVLEKTTNRLTGVLQDETGAVVVAAQLSALTLTLFDVASGTKINSWDNQDALNTNGVTVDSSGNLVWTMVPNDNALVDSTKQVELHRALFKWTWASGVKTGRHYIDIVVENLDTVT